MTTPLEGGTPPTFDELNAQKVDDLVETYGVPKASKADVIASILDKFGVPQPKSGEVILAILGMATDSYDWNPDEPDVPPITREGAAVPAAKAETIIAAAAAQGVTIREVS